MWASPPTSRGTRAARPPRTSSSTWRRRAQRSGSTRRIRGIVRSKLLQAPHRRRMWGFLLFLIHKKAQAESLSCPDHLASGALALSSARFESRHNSRTPGDHMSDSRSSIAALSDQLADAVASAGASVVAVHARPRLPSTGVHWKDGVVVTTEGTVRQEEDITVTLPDGKSIPATFAGRDRGADLAVLAVALGSLRVAELGDPAVLRPGNLVLALARLDEGGARAAFGAVKATGGKWRAWKGGEIDRWLQSDLTIYPGFGGGPLVDSTGQIHGINSGALSRPLATTIPVETVNRVVAQLLERGYVARGWIGAAMQPVRFDEGDGLLLVSIEKDTPAAKAGLLLCAG